MHLQGLTRENLPGADSPGLPDGNRSFLWGEETQKREIRHRTNHLVQLHYISVANNKEQREGSLVPEERQWGELSSSWTRSRKRRRATSPHGSLSIEHNIKQALHCVPNVSVPSIFSLLQRFALEYTWPGCLNQLRNSSIVVLITIILKKDSCRVGEVTTTSEKPRKLCTSLVWALNEV